MHKNTNEQLFSELWFFSWWEEASKSEFEKLGPSYLLTEKWELFILLRK